MRFGEVISLSLYLLGYAVCVMFALRHYLHMFQLNSYKPNVQMKWFKNNIKGITLKTLPALAIIPIILFIPKTGVTCAGIYYIILAYTNRKVKMKKPLVYTKRVIRLSATLGVISALCILPIFITAYAGFINRFYLKLLMSLITVLYYFLLPFVVLVANLVNKPIENAINNKFISEAENIIKSMPDLKVIGITGSFGKTSVKYYLTKLLSSKYNVLMTPESYNTTLGVVRTIREKMRATHEIFVCEMGARNVGDIKEICDIVHPDLGIITSVGPQHLESFKTIDNIKKTKFELANSLPESGTAFLNANDENIKSVGYSRNNITYGVEAGDYSAFDLSLSQKGTTFKVKAPNGEIGEFTTKLIGKHNVQNITGAIAIAHSLNISMAQLSAPVKKLESVPHRLELSQRGNITIIDDAYNSNPNGTKVALSTLAMFDGIKIIITPGMVELGEKQDEYNFAFGENCSEVCDYIILVGKKQTDSISKGVRSKNYPEDKLIICDTINEAFEKLYAIDSGDKQKIALLENDLPDNFL